MKLTIVAATGGVGRELLDQAVAAGHDVYRRGPQSGHNLSPGRARHQPLT